MSAAKETAAQKKKREAEEAKAQEAAQAAAEEEASQADSEEDTDTSQTLSDEPDMLPSEDVETKQSSLQNLREWADEAARNGATFEEAKQVLVDSNLPAEE